VQQINGISLFLRMRVRSLTLKNSWGVLSNSWIPGTHRDTEYSMTVVLWTE